MEFGIMDLKPSDGPLKGNTYTGTPYIPRQPWTYPTSQPATYPSPTPVVPMPWVDPPLVRIAVALERLVELLTPADPDRHPII
jgi:hypothetical protein